MKLISLTGRAKIYTIKFYDPNLCKIVNRGFRTPIEVLDFAVTQDRDKYVDSITPELLTYAIDNNHAIMMVKKFDFA
jgi:hypothetical protein